MWNVLNLSGSLPYKEHVEGYGIELIDSFNRIHNSVVQSSVDCTINMLNTSVQDTRYIWSLVQPGVVFCRHHVGTMVTFSEEMRLCNSLISHGKWQRDMAAEEIGEFKTRLLRNKRERIPGTIRRLKNLYKLLDQKLRVQDHLLKDLDFWGPVVMAQERKIRMLNKAWEECKENHKVKVVRDLGRHVDMELISMKDRLRQMTEGVQRELTFIAGLE